jgi:predicted O-methyltransferase YrrM
MIEDATGAPRAKLQPRASGSPKELSRIHAMPETWGEVDRHLAQRLHLEDEALAGALAASDAAGLPAIGVSAPQGRFLSLLARIANARRILEIGTLAGYSGIWLARALPEGGRLVTLEIDPAHAAVARANFERAGVAGFVDLRVGPALELLPELAAEGIEPFDFTFIDADKASSPEYLQWAIRLSRPGATIVLDNVVRNGALLLSGSRDPDVQGVRRAIDLLGSDPRVEATAIQTVGIKGYDGFALAVVKGTAAR